MTKKTFLNDLQTEDIRPEDLDLDAAVPASEPEEEVRYYPLLDGRYTAKEADRLMAKKQAKNL